MQVWDLPLRVFHWLLVIAILSAYLSGTAGGLWLEWHAHIGILILSLIVFRIAWGFLGSTNARFSSFIPTTARLRAFISSGWNEPGHNPLGALFIFLMLGNILAQAVVGLFALDDESEFYGPFYEVVSAGLAERFTHWHMQLFDVLLFLMAMHLLAIAYYLLIKRRNLVLPMLTGRSLHEDRLEIIEVQGGGMVQFLISLSLAGGMVWLLESGFLLACLMYVR